MLGARAASATVRDGLMAEKHLSQRGTSTSCIPTMQRRFQLFFPPTSLSLSFSQSLWGMLLWSVGVPSDA